MYNLKDVFLKFLFHNLYLKCLILKIYVPSVSILRVDKFRYVCFCFKSLFYEFEEVSK